jgi:hypothetical protein
MRGSPHHYCWQAGCDDQLQNLDLDACHHLDQHFLLHSQLDFVQQAMLDLEQVFVEQLLQDHFQPLHCFQVDLDSLQFDQSFLDQLQVHNIVQVVQHALQNLFVLLGQALRVQLDIFQVHK